MISGKNLSIILSSILLSVSCVFSSYAQVKQQGLVYRIPKHLPIKVEVLNEDSDDVLKDVRIKVTNTGEKPIYFLSIYIETRKDFLTPEGLPYGFFMQYGRTKLIDVNNFANSEDVPIKPGETYTFRVEEKLAKRFKEKSDSENRQPPKLFNLHFEMMNFGDGTGYLGTGAGYVYSSKRNQ